MGPIASPRTAARPQSASPATPTQTESARTVCADQRTVPESAGSMSCGGTRSDRSVGGATVPSPAKSDRVSAAVCSSSNEPCAAPGTSPSAGSLAADLVPACSLIILSTRLGLCDDYLVCRAISSLSTSRARWSRDFTVPSARPVTCMISSYDSSSTSRSTSSSRCSSSSLVIARWTIEPKAEDP